MFFLIFPFLSLIFIDYQTDFIDFPVVSTFLVFFQQAFSLYLLLLLLSIQSHVMGIYNINV